uniref:Terpene synthase N-terminal domain-containing protein n=1 Tax=Kalanchoe fedtschenkoi TaxID=63787 RepID=A0A7N0V2X4_KALFE
MHAQTLKEVRDAVGALGEDPSQGLAVLEAIQRLGIDHHFQDEIKSILTKQRLEWEDTHQQAELHQVALCFRLLRQHGYTVSARCISKIPGQGWQIQRRDKSGHKWVDKFI